MTEAYCVKCRKKVEMKDEQKITMKKRKSGKVNQYAGKIFWELDEKHGTRLSDVCSTSAGKGEIKKRKRKNTQTKKGKEIRRKREEKKRET